MNRREKTRSLGFYEPDISRASRHPDMLVARDLTFAPISNCTATGRLHLILATCDVSRRYHILRKTYREGRRDLLEKHSEIFLRPEPDSVGTDEWA